MALNWNWNRKCGEMITVDPLTGKEFTQNLYQGNALLIMISEWHDEDRDSDMYNLWSFWCDKEHMRNCLGLSKGKTADDNIYAGRIKSVSLNKAMFHSTKDIKDIVDALIAAFDDIVIRVYSEESEVKE